MTSVGYLSQPTLEEFGPPLEADPRPETCWRTNSDGGWVDSRWLYEALIKGDVFLADDWLQETFLDYVEKQVCIEFSGAMTRSDPPQITADCVRPLSCCC